MDTLQNFYLLLPRSLCHLFFFFKGVLSYLHRKLNLILWLLSRPVILLFSYAFPRLWTVDCGSRVSRRYIPLTSSHMLGAAYRDMQQCDQKSSARNFSYQD